MTELREVVICAPLRTPVGRMGGALAAVSALELATTVLRALARAHRARPGRRRRRDRRARATRRWRRPRSAGSPRSMPASPSTTTGYQLDRRCGSGLQAVLNAAMEVQTGVADVVIALGAESMSNAPLYTVEGRRGVTGAGLLLHDALARGRETVGGRRFPDARRQRGRRRDCCAPTTASRARRRTRSPCARTSARSPRRSRARSTPSSCRSRCRAGAAASLVDRDEHPRADTSLEALAGLRPMLRRAGCRGDRHRRQLERPERRGRRVHRDDARSAPPSSGSRRCCGCVSWAVAGNDPLRFGVAPGAGGEPRARARRHPASTTST